MIKKIIFVAVVIGVAIFAGKFLKEKKEAIYSRAKPITYTKSIKTTTAKDMNISRYREFLAQVQSSSSAFISSKFSATIKKIHVSEAASVKKGQLLVSLDDSELKASLASLKDRKLALEADLNNAKNILKRNKKLLEIEAISKEAYDNSEVMYKNKLASLGSINQNIKQILSQMKYLNITAPFDGVVGTKSANVGSLALPGKPLLTINTKDQKLIFSYIDTSYPITLGQKVYIDKKPVGVISKIYDDAKNALLVAEIKPYNILPFVNKSYKNIEVEVDYKEGCALPMDAILHKKDKTYVMVYKDNKFNPQEVKILLNNQNYAILKECPKELVAVGSEAKLSMLPTYGKINILKEENR